MRLLTQDFLRWCTEANMWNMEDIQKSFDCDRTDRMSSIIRTGRLSSLIRGCRTVVTIGIFVFFLIMGLFTWHQASWWQMGHTSQRMKRILGQELGGLTRQSPPFLPNALVQLFTVLQPVGSTFKGWSPHEDDALYHLLIPMQHPPGTSTWSWAPWQRCWWRTPASMWSLCAPAQGSSYWRIVPSQQMGWGTS